MVVTDELLTRCVSDVRNAIGDSDQKIIKTVPRRGYRFAAPVSPLGIDLATVPSTAGATAGAMLVGSDARRPELLISDRPSIAVLPFANFSGDPQQEYFCDGITEDIITNLSRFSELFVIARNSTFRYKGKTVDVRQIGRELVCAMCWKAASGGTVTVSASTPSSSMLLPAPTAGRSGTTARSRTFSQSRMRWHVIVAVLAAYVKKAEAERTLLKPPATWEAYDYYLRGAEAYSLNAESALRHRFMKRGVCLSNPC